ncbi:MAG: protein-methionine-sulfoxide reductase heme-binding subunit MsrQ [Pseudomonadales bacterium]|nr:protein-methionine-sulfoxide reductase heme-binding subunit MsrQ [Pseudomonadales bacterium]
MPVWIFVKTTDIAKVWKGLIQPVRNLLRPSVFLISLIPLLLMILAVVNNDLGPDPAKALALDTGRWTLRFLLLCLLVTPLREMTGWSKLAPLRRTLGLYAWFYATLHFLVYVIFLLQLRWFEISDDILERPYITVGFLAFLMLCVLASTSNKFMMRHLGRRWKKLHRLVYVVGALGIIHLTWILRTDITDAVFYATILLLLLGYRLLAYLRRYRLSKV